METIENKTFEEIAIGERASLTKAIERHDIELFAAVSGDANPIHLDEELAAKTPFKGVVAHGMLTAGLISNLLGNRLPGPGTIYLAQDLRFHRPVRVGDVVTATVTAKEKRPEKRIVVFDCAVTNQRGEVVLTGTAEVITQEKLRGPAPALPEVTLRRHEKYEQLIERTKGIPAIPCAVAHPCERHALEGALLAAERGIIVPILVAPSPKLRRIAEEAGLSLEGIELVDVPHSHAAAAKAVELVRKGQAQMLMKGSLHTDELMAEVVARETGLRTERRISHVFIMDVPTYPEPLFITDAAINIFPDLETKRDIVQNAIDLHIGLGLGSPGSPSSRRSRRSHPRSREPSKPRLCARWPSAARSRVGSSTVPWPSTTPSASKQRRSRASARRWRGGPRSSSSPISRRATCWPRTSPFSPEPRRRGWWWGHGCRSCSRAVPTACAPAWRPRRSPRFTPMPA